MSGNISVHFRKYNKYKYITIYYVTCSDFDKNVGFLGISR